MRSARLAPLFLILLASVAKADDQAIQALSGGFAAAFNSGDSVRLGQLYADDAVLMPPGGKLIKGKGAIEQYYRAALRSVKDSQFTPLDSRALGDTEAVEMGSFTSKTAGAHSRAVVGKFVILWRKVDGAWKINLDIWNTDS